MSNVPVFVGLDYHQDSVQVCVLNPQGEVLLNRSAANDCLELGRIVSPLGVVSRVGIEACCGAADLGQELAERLGWSVSLGHPAYIAKIKSSPDKSDYSDGRLLADLTRVGYLPRVWLAPAYVRDLRQLVNHRQRLVDRGRALKLPAAGAENVLDRERTFIEEGEGGVGDEPGSGKQKRPTPLSGCRSLEPANPFAIFPDVRGLWSAPSPASLMRPPSVALSGRPSYPLNLPAHRVRSAQSAVGSTRCSSTSSSRNAASPSSWLKPMTRWATA